MLVDEKEKENEANQKKFDSGWSGSTSLTNKINFTKSLNLKSLQN